MNNLLNCFAFPENPSPLPRLEEGDAFDKEWVAYIFPGKVLGMLKTVIVKMAGPPQGGPQ